MLALKTLHFSIIGSGTMFPKDMDKTTLKKMCLHESPPCKSLETEDSQVFKSVKRRHL